MNDCAAAHTRASMPSMPRRVDGSRPDVWRFIEDVREPGLDADYADYR